jgi:hypothetical protein
MPGTYVAGNRGTATINSNEVPTISWTFKDNAKIVPIRNSMTQQVTIYIATFRDADVMLVLDKNTSQPIYLAPFAIQSGSVIAAKLYDAQTGNDTLDGPFYNITSMVISTVEENVVVDDKIGVRVTGKASGTYAYPTA